MSASSTRATDVDTATSTDADADGTLDRLAVAVTEFRRAALACDVLPANTERAELAELLGLVNDVCGWAATTLENVAAAVVDGLPYAATRGFVNAVAGVADAQDPLEHTIAVLLATPAPPSPAATRRPEPGSTTS